MNTEIRKGIDNLFPGTSLVELRIPKSSAGTIVGYFYDRDKLEAAIEQYSGNVQAVYYTLNTPSSELYDLTSAKDKALTGANATKDPQITIRNWMLIDCDPVRQCDDQKVSSSDEEKAAALETLQKIHEYLAGLDWPSPISADSGNGYHLLYNLGGIESTAEVTSAIHSALDYLAARFNTAAVKIDTTVYNASRITKAYGSLAGKGESSEERPHRLSKIRYVPEKIEAVTLDQISRLKIEQKPSKTGIVIVAKTPAKYATAATEPEKVEQFLSYYELDHKVRHKETDGWSWQLFPCPFDSTHDIGEVGVSLSEKGVMGFKCFHESCKDNHWQEFKAYLETKSGKKFFFSTNLAVAVPAEAVPTSTLLLEKASSIPPESLTWLWPKRIPFGKLTLFAGHPGVGKGMATMYVAACASTGTGWVDCDNTNSPVESIIVSSEDSAGDTLIPRLIAAGADMNMINIVRKTMTPKGDKIFGLDVDMPALRTALESNKNIKLIVIDPIMNHLGKLKGNVEQEVRAGLTPLGQLAEDFGVAVVLVTHFNKNTNAEGIQRVGGAMAMTGAVRMAWTFTEDRDDEKKKMLSLKKNISPDLGGLEYEIVNTPTPINGQMEDIGRIVFGAKTFSSFETSLKMDMNGGKPSQTAQAREWLSDFLSNGEPFLRSDITMAGESMGFKDSMINKAAEKLDINKFKEGGVDGKWFWQMAKED